MKNSIFEHSTEKKAFYESYLAACHDNTKLNIECFEMKHLVTKIKAKITKILAV